MVKSDIINYVFYLKKPQILSIGVSHFLSLPFQIFPICVVLKNFENFLKSRLYYLSSSRVLNKVLSWQ